MRQSELRTRRRRLTPVTLFVAALHAATFAQAADERHYVGPANGNWNDSDPLEPNPTAPAGRTCRRGESRVHRATPRRRRRLRRQLRGRGPGAGPSDDQR